MAPVIWKRMSNVRQFLETKLGLRIIVRPNDEIKKEYNAILCSVDETLNLQLADTLVYVNGICAGNIGMVSICREVIQYVHVNSHMSPNDSFCATTIARAGAGGSGSSTDNEVIVMNDSQDSVVEAIHSSGNNKVIASGNAKHNAGNVNPVVNSEADHNEVEASASECQCKLIMIEISGETLSTDNNESDKSAGNIILMDSAVDIDFVENIIRGYSEVEASAIEGHDELIWILITEHTNVPQNGSVGNNKTISIDSAGDIKMVENNIGGPNELMASDSSSENEIIVISDSEDSQVEEINSAVNNKVIASGNAKHNETISHRSANEIISIDSAGDINMAKNGIKLMASDSPSDDEIIVINDSQDSVVEVIDSCDNNEVIANGNAEHNEITIIDNAVNLKLVANGEAGHSEEEASAIGSHKSILIENTEDTKVAENGSAGVNEVTARFSAGDNETISIRSADEIIPIDSAGNIEMVGNGIGGPNERMTSDSPHDTEITAIDSGGETEMSANCNADDKETIVKDSARHTEIVIDGSGCKTETVDSCIADLYEVINAC